ncbi:hypothetical protein KJ951_04375 [Patescibacteria group bacterium]|nr:hypothetical protein [Patescibacteria group bacterium]MBU1703614.1 hypothetical protein [Patescibacteria group bacterium]MBU1953555.1 hypothetical protein [Patescibacteria group bacterium]
MPKFQRRFAQSVLIFLILPLFFSGCASKEQSQNQPTISSNNTFEIPIQKDENAQLTTQQSTDLQSNLILLDSLYIKAVITTNTALSATPKDTSWEEWQNATEISLLAWEELETELDRIGLVLDDIEQPANNKTAYIKDNFNLFHVAYAAAPDPALVTAVFDANPNSTNKLKDLMNFFGWDAKTALNQLKIAQSQIESNAWNEEGDAEEMLANQAKIILDSMKVSLMIGGMAMTAGATTPTLPSSAASIYAKGSLILGGTDLAMAIGEDAMIVIGNENGEAVLKQKRENIAVPCKIVSIINLKDVENPENLVTITELGLEYGQKVLDWGTDMRADLDPTGAKLKFGKSQLTGDLPAINPEDIERFRLNAKKAWEEMGVPQMIKDAEKNIREQKKQVDAELGNLNKTLAGYLDQKEQLLYDLGILKTMAGGTFSSVDQSAIDRMYKQLENLNNKIDKLETDLKTKGKLSESLNLDETASTNSGESQSKAPMPEILQANGTWTSVHGDSGSINLSFPSAGGAFSGGFSSCPNGICWNSTVSGTFDGNDPGTVSGTVSGSVAATEHTPKFIISGSFTGTVNLKEGTVKGTFSNGLIDTSGQYPKATDSGSWQATFDTGE